MSQRLSRVYLNQWSSQVDQSKNPTKLTWFEGWDVFAQTKVEPSQHGLKIESNCFGLKVELSQSKPKG